MMIHDMSSISRKGFRMAISDEAKLRASWKDSQTPVQ